MAISSLWGLVREAASRAPAAKTAVFTADHCCSYETLIQRASGIAAALHSAGIGRGDRVGIWMDKTPSCVQAILGVLAVGAAYVPLDPRAPWRRCRTIALDCDFAGIIADGPRLPSFASVVQDLKPRLVLLEASGDAIARAALPKELSVESFDDAAMAPSMTLSDPAPEDLAYILYTSGSTGIPKGVMHTHRSGLAFTQWIQNRFAIREDDIFSSHAPFHFDLSISDLYASLGSGASVRLISGVESMLPAYLVKLIKESGISVWYSVPSILVSMLDVGQLEGKEFPNLRIVFFAGEVFPAPQLRRLRCALPTVGLYNLFGPTETNVCTYYEVPREIHDEGTSAIPIGRACEHLETFVLDASAEEVGTGVEGVLWVKGGNLMSGYWNDAARTGATLVSDPRRGNRQGKDLAYCTGDYVRLMSDGNYQFLGRRDHMVKVRGFRVELGEIEKILASCPGVLEAIAIPLPDPTIGNRIVASVVPRSGEQLNATHLRAYCSRFLPTYMVPEHIEIRVTMIRTSTGKTDRQALYQEWQSRIGS
ncbi:MAG TPA: amino acid adenylation domain-containing protein [Terriglobales bacterium]|nr:amino acid adenylation domain-containing protein [Terriglobales bacterium]